MNLIIKVIIIYNYNIIVNKVITSICSILLWSCSSFSFFVRLSRSLVYETGLFNPFIFNPFILLSTNLISLFCRLCIFYFSFFLSIKFTCSVYKVILISLYCLFCLSVLRYCLSCPLILPFFVHPVCKIFLLCQLFLLNPDKNLPLLSMLFIKCSHWVWHVY